MVDPFLFYSLVNTFNDSIKKENGIYIASPVDDGFEKQYIKIRDKEGRILSDTEVEQLPNTVTTNPRHKEWNLRKQSTHRFLNYLKCNKFKSLLEIGCGNGWFTNQCAQHVTTTTGIDVNMTELEQAARVFQNSTINFVYWDIFNESPFTHKFDIIVINATIQYFKEPKLLFSRLKKLLNQGGEIHIIDSPFYPEDQIKAAHERSTAYYNKLGVSEMALFYFHHSTSVIHEFEILHTPKKSLFHKLIGKKTNPFNWYRKVY